MIRRSVGLVTLTVAALFIGLPAPATGQLASRPAEAWSKMLDQPERLAGLRVEEVLARLQLKPGQVVADLGAGTGVFSVPM